METTEGARGFRRIISCIGRSDLFSTTSRHATVAHSDSSVLARRSAGHSLYTLYLAADCGAVIAVLRLGCKLWATGTVDRMHHLSTVNSLANTLTQFKCTQTKQEYLYVVVDWQSKDSDK